MATGIAQASGSCITAGAVLVMGEGEGDGMIVHNTLPPHQRV